MLRFEIADTPLSGLMIVQRTVRDDHRGFLSRVYCAQELGEAGLTKPVAQINLTRTRQSSTVRGMHFQHAPHQEVKFVSCLRGKVFDVAVDLRRKSPTFLQWHAEILSEVNYRSLLIPEGFAHGFQTLSEDCELLYLHTAAYAPEAEGAVNAMDPRLAIAWPLPVREMSDRDRSHPPIQASFQGITV